METLVERHSREIVGVLSCLDRVVIAGTLPDMGYRGAAERFLERAGIALDDFAVYFKGLRDKLDRHAKEIAAIAGLSVEYIKRKNFRKDDRIKEILAKRGDEPGLVHVFSAMEPCNTYRVQGGQQGKKRYLASRYGKCLHYYFYFIDVDLGLCYCRVETWTPFRLQFYFNGHNWLAGQLKKAGIGYTLVENAFTKIDDFSVAQRSADRFSSKWLHRKLDEFAQKFCPVKNIFSSSYHWSFMQVEYATDVIFTSSSALKPLYDNIVRTALHSANADNVASFFSRTFHGHFKGEIVNDFSTSARGTRVKHSMKKAAIKMYDKHGMVLRIETTASDVSFFKHHRTVVQRDGTKVMKLAPMRKSIHSCKALLETLCLANNRYLDFVSSLDDPSEGYRHLNKIADPVRVEDRCYRGFNLFDKDDLELLLVIVRGEFNISGMRNRDLRIHLKKNGSQASRLLKRLHLHGLIKKISGTYKYYLTKLGRVLISCALQLRQEITIPTLSRAYSE